jgi:hypothetical protein
VKQQDDDSPPPSPWRSLVGCLGAALFLLMWFWSGIVLVATALGKLTTPRPGDKLILFCAFVLFFSAPFAVVRVRRWGPGTRKG